MLQVRSRFQVLRCGSHVTLRELRAVVGDNPGDSTKIRRVAQNLILRTVKYKRGDSAPNDSKGWRFLAADPGSGVQVELAQFTAGAIHRGG